jgi:hypothetical protein
MLALIKSRFDPSGQCLSFFNGFGALRAAAEVMFYRLSFVAGESIKEVIVQGLFC